MSALYVSKMGIMPVLTPIFIIYIHIMCIRYIFMYFHCIFVFQKICKNTLSARYYNYIGKPLR